MSVDGLRRRMRGARSGEGRRLYSFSTFIAPNRIRGHQEPQPVLGGERAPGEHRRWLHERYHHAPLELAPLASCPKDLPEFYCEVLEHKWYLSESAQRDVGLEFAIEDYVRLRGLQGALE